MLISGWLYRSFAGWLDRIEKKLDAQKATLQQLLQGQAKIMASLADIRAKVEAERTVEDSIVVLLQSVSQQLKDAIKNNDPAAMQAVADMLDRNTTVLSDAVAANTPTPTGGTDPSPTA